MNISEKEKIDKLIENRNHAHTFYSKTSQVYGYFTQMEQSAYQDKSLASLHKELIAVGISVVINCESCMEWHIKKALDSGATQDQVIEAVEVGIEMGGGSATVSARFALSVLEYYSMNF